MSLAACASLLDIPEDPRLDEGGATGALFADDSGAEVSGQVPASSDMQVDDDPPLVTPGRAPALPQHPEAGASPPGEAPGGDGGVLPVEPPIEPSIPEPPALNCPAPASLGPNGRCFLVLDEQLPWADAQQSCRARGAGWDLATIHTEAVSDFLVAQVAIEAWIGATDAGDEGTWRWVDDGSVFWQGDETGAPVDGAFANWNSTEPNGFGASDCARLVPNQDNTWADLECELPRGAVCEGPAS